MQSLSYTDVDEYSIDLSLCKCHWLRLRHRIHVTSQNLTIKNNNDYLYGGQHAYQYAYSAI